MNFILGTKIRMTQLFAADGRVTPVTEISVKPNTVIRVKTKETDKYESVVLAYGDRNKVGKAIAGFFKNFGKFRYIKEFRTEGHQIDLKEGDRIGLDSFAEGDKVKVSSVSKGKGFQGVVKRHGFAGGPRTHGDKDQMRMGGSIGATAPARVFKGVKMPGRMGNDMVTVANLEIMKIDLENNLLYLKGAIAGGSNALVMIKGDGNLKVYEETKKIEKVEEVVEEPKIVADIDNSIEIPLNTEEAKPQENEGVVSEVETPEVVEDTKEEIKDEVKEEVK